MDEVELVFMVGEIRSDVKKLLVQDREYDKRIHSLERTRWYAGGFLGAALAIVAAKMGLHAPLG